MEQSIRVNTKTRGRPKTTGKGHLVGVRLLPDLLAALDAFRAAHAGELSRPEAVRLLVRRGLDAPLCCEPRTDPPPPLSNIPLLGLSDR